MQISFCAYSLLTGMKETVANRLFSMHLVTSSLIFAVFGELPFPPRPKRYFSAAIWLYLSPGGFLVAVLASIYQSSLESDDKSVHPGSSSTATPPGGPCHPHPIRGLR